MNRTERTSRSSRLAVVTTVLALALTSCGFLDALEDAIADLVAGGISFDTAGNLSAGGFQVLDGGRTVESWQAKSEEDNQRIADATDAAIVEFLNNRDAGIGPAVVGDRTTALQVDKDAKDAGPALEDYDFGGPNEWTEVALGADDSGKGGGGQYHFSVGLNIPAGFNTDAKFYEDPTAHDAGTYNIAKGKIIAGLVLGYELDAVRNADGSWQQKVYNVNPRTITTFRRALLRGLETQEDVTYSAAPPQNGKGYGGADATDHSGTNYLAALSMKGKWGASIGPVSANGNLFGLPDGAQLLIYVDKVRGPVLRITPHYWRLEYNNRARTSPSTAPPTKGK